MTGRIYPGKNYVLKAHLTINVTVRPLRALPAVKCSDISQNKLLSLCFWLFWVQVLALGQSLRLEVGRIDMNDIVTDLTV
jgi:hypothetical protein